MERELRRKKLWRKALEIKANTGTLHDLNMWATIAYQEFAWRDSPSHFHGLIAELLLQRTTAKAAARAYDNFVARFPTIESLARASELEVFEVVGPIGLRSRAENLRTLARQVMERYNGEVPQDFDALISLRGVGEYAATAFLCFHCGVKIAIADSNVQRVAGRLIGAKVSVQEARKFFEAILPDQEVRGFALGFLDFAMKICRPNPWRPQCEVCPLQRHCKTGQAIISGKKPKWL